MHPLAELPRSSGVTFIHRSLLGSLLECDPLAGTLIVRIRALSCFGRYDYSATSSGYSGSPLAISTVVTLSPRLICTAAGTPYTAGFLGCLTLYWGWFASQSVAARFDAIRAPLFYTLSAGAGDCSAAQAPLL